MSSENTQTTAVEKYFEQRVVTSGETTTLTIDGVHIDSKANKIILQGHVDTEDIELRVDLTDETDVTQDFLSWLYITDDGQIDATHRVNDYIELVFDDETETFTHVQTGCELTASEITTEITERDAETVTQELREVFTRFAYELTDPPHGKEHGLVCEVSNISDPDGDSFILTAYPAAGVDLHWELQIPHVSEISNSSLEVLIEEEGGGNPEFIADGGEVVIIHESDTTSSLDVIGFDESGEWGIIPPSTHESWDETEDETEPSNSTSTSTSTSNSSTTSPSYSSSSSSGTASKVTKQRKEKGKRMVMNSIILIFALEIVRAVMTQLLTRLPASATETTFITTLETIMNFTHILVIMPLFYGVLLITVSK